jgi:hypothetical protein
MNFIHSWRGQINDFGAAPWPIVSLLTLFSKHMSDVIGIVFLKFISIHFLGELLLPKDDGFIHCET